jgi:hypothetical protein
MSCGCRSGWPGHHRGRREGRDRGADWAGRAEPFAERALDILDAYAPGTRAKILGRRIVTPAMLEADNPNLVGGDQICGSHHLSAELPVPPRARPCGRIDAAHQPAPDRGRRLAGGRDRRRTGLPPRPEARRKLKQNNIQQGKRP